MADLSLHALTEGLQQARRIIRDAAGYHHAGETVAFAAEYKRQAERALEELEMQARLWRVHSEFAKWRDRQREDMAAIEREVDLPWDGRVLR
jgi:hypothetical protein